jgi:diguanylate cyclase (GGDEF)-like protein
VPFPAVDPPRPATSPLTPAIGRVPATPFGPPADGHDGNGAGSGAAPAITPSAGRMVPVPDVAFEPHPPGGDGAAPASSCASAMVLHQEAGAALVTELAGTSAPSRAGEAPTVLRALSQPLALAVIAPIAGALLGICLAVADADLSVVGVACAVLGLGLGGLGAALVLRRVHHQVDQPLLGMQRTLLRIQQGEIDARVGVESTTPLQPLIEHFNGVAELTATQLNVLRRKAEWGDQSRMIFEALELAEDEADAYLVMEDALALLELGRRVELLMASRGQSRLRPAAHNPTVPAPGCPVESTVGCVAIRRGQVVTADSSESINSCPRLRDRPDGPCSAGCVPVTVAGQPIGVLHAVGPDREALDTMFVDRLVTVAAQLGNRVAALRALETSREEAATDGLTGLSNRRVLEGQLVQLLDSAVPFVMVLADLDSFKVLNDTFGHEAGDRALQLFAKVLQDNIRDHDLVARVGGEEFVVVYPEMSVLRSIEAIERIRQALETSIAKSSVQPFTCSFGVTHSSVGSTVNEVLRVADAGLLRAKALGGDQVVYADEAIAAEVFGSTAPNQLGIRLY